MARNIGKKAINLIIVMFLMSLLAFLAIRVMPGDPIALMFGEKDVSPKVMENIKKIYNLDKPLLEQYILYIKDLLKFDFGYSYFFVGKSVNDLIYKAFRNTFKLAILAFPVSAILGIVLGCLAAYKNGKFFDKLLNFITAILTAIPDVPLAIFLAFIFAMKLKIFPIAGWGQPKHLFLPAIFISLWPSLSLAKMVRALVIEELGKPYVYMCRARGMGYMRIIVLEVMPNTLIPVTTSLGMMFGRMLEGTFIAELVFNIPGLGRVAVDSIFKRDYPVIMGIILLSTFTYTSINFVMDILHYVLDPRLRGRNEVV
ncbi:ABC transporter permease [Tissierella sp.]|uniref:ABC transporter permease n=1 Tax=Tissierella sp. TaxID=41274 RepID=UPI0028A8903D|nr:ABC transporter permease [Tissierella sp.]